MAKRFLVIGGILAASALLYWACANPQIKMGPLRPTWEVQP